MKKPFLLLHKARQQALSAALLCGLFSPFAQAEIVAIVAANNPAANLEKSQVAELFMGKSSVFPNGATAEPVDLPGDSPAREQFYQSVTGKSAAQVKSYWARMAFTGKGVPPLEVGSAEEMKKTVAANANMIGYIDNADVDVTVKVLFKAE